MEEISESVSEFEHTWDDCGEEEDNGSGSNSDSDEILTKELIDERIRKNKLESLNYNKNIFFKNHDSI